MSRSFLPERTSVDGQTDWGGRGWTERSEGSPGVSGYRPPTPATPELPSLQFLDPILAHELLHIRRGDLSFGMLQVIAQCLWWFHPAVWFSNRWLSREAERCCDEQVIAELGCSPGQYARSLLAVIESKHALQPIPVFPGMKPVEITTQRTERIMSLKTGLNKRTPLWCWLSVVALAIVVLPGAAAQTSADASVGDEASAVQDAVTTTETNKNVPAPATVEDKTAQLTARIRLADDFIPSSKMNLTGNSVVAFVDEMPIAVNEIIGDWVLTRMEQDKNLPIEERRVLLIKWLTERLPNYLYEEVVMTHYADNITESGKVKIGESLNQEFAVLLDKIYSDNGLADGEALEKWLLPQGLSVGQLKKMFHRSQIAVGYLQTLPEESPLRDKDVILEHYRQMIRSASQVANVSVSSPETEPPTGIRLLPDSDSTLAQPPVVDAHTELAKAESPTEVEVSVQDKEVEAKPAPTADTPRLVIVCYAVGDPVKPVFPTFTFAETRNESSNAAAAEATADSPSNTAVAQPSPRVNESSAEKQFEV